MSLTRYRGFWINRERYMSSYTRRLQQRSDIQEHLGLLHGLALDCDRIVEFGFRTGVSTSAFLAAGCQVQSYDVDRKCRPYVQALAKEYPKSFCFKLESSLTADIPRCDMLFIDSDHTEATTMVELLRHRNDVRKWIVLHDTVTFERVDRPPGKGRGIMTAVDAFMDAHLDWCVYIELKNGHGLTVLEREG